MHKNPKGWQYVGRNCGQKPKLMIMAHYPEEDRVIQYYELKFFDFSFKLIWKYVREGRKFRIILA